MNKKYKEYLQSEQWKFKRIELFIERGRICEMCGSKKNIQVHHKTYKRIFNEKISDLMVVCINCHNSIHDIESKNKHKPKNLSKNKLSKRDKMIKRLDKLAKYWIKNDCAKR